VKVPSQCITEVQNAWSFTYAPHVRLHGVVVRHKDNVTLPFNIITHMLDYGLDDRGSRVRFPPGAGNFSLHRRVQNGSGSHPASYPLVTRALSLVVKRLGRGADHSLLSPAEFEECVELYLHSFNTPSWRGA
jgi:hypothetical protein